MNHAPIDDLITRGWARWPRYLAADERAALEKPQVLTWARMAPRVGPVTQRGWFAQAGFEEAPAAVQVVGADIERRVVAALGCSTPGFNEVTWQRYEREDGFITPHRDQAFYTGPIAVLTLVGRAEFSVLESREPPVTVDSWVSEDGDLALLRGAGLGSSAARCPIHSVGAPDAERRTLTFRHNTRGPGGWAKG
ncbi:MAG: hypothetical protein ACRDWE_01970 [Acidimicrobiales bacterium]